MTLIRLACDFALDLLTHEWSENHEWSTWTSSPMFFLQNPVWSSVGILSPSSFSCLRSEVWMHMVKMSECHASVWAVLDHFDVPLFSISLVGTIDSLPRRFKPETTREIKTTWRTSNIANNIIYYLRLLLYSTLPKIHAHHISLQEHFAPPTHIRTLINQLNVSPSWSTATLQLQNSSLSWWPFASFCLFLGCSFGRGTQMSEGSLMTEDGSCDIDQEVL